MDLFATPSPKSPELDDADPKQDSFLKNNMPWAPSRFANPLPLALIGLLMSLSPLSAMLLQWRGAGGTGAANTTAYIFFGGTLMGISGLMEFFYGQTYLFVVFFSYSAFFFSIGTDFIPWFNVAAAYDPNDPVAASETPEFAASFAFFFLYMGILNFIFLICAMRTNVVLTLIFLTLVPALLCLAGSEWVMAEGNKRLAIHLQKGAGGLAFATSVIGWYYLLEEMLSDANFPIRLPLVDLSGLPSRIATRNRSQKRPSGVNH